MSGEGEGVAEAIVSAFRDGSLVASQRSYARDDVVCREGEPGDTLHVITDGMFAVRTATPTGESLILDILEVGDVFGEFALFSVEGQRTSGVTSLTEGATLEVGREELRALMTEGQDIGEQMIAMIAHKAERTSRRLVELLYVPAELRVLKAVIELTRRRDSNEVNLTQRELASYAATTRPTANRVLREEAERGTLTVARGVVTVLDSERLARRARSDPGPA